MWRSSSVPITQKDLSSSRSAGWSNERSHGSGDAGVSPKIGRISTERHSHFCASLQSGSCSENYAILHDLSGQTLSDLSTCVQSSGKRLRRLVRRPWASASQHSLSTERRRSGILMNVSSGSSVENL